jgi:cobalt-zinc-cadmium efflux system membrane fusion protein
MKRFLVPPALACVAAFAFACGKAADDEAAGEHEAVVDASVITIAAQRFVETVDAIGTVVARAGHVASLAAAGQTRVTAVPVVVGARVHTGDVLVELEKPPFEAAVRAADAALAAAQSAADRAQRLADAGVLPRKDAEQAAAELAQARTNAQSAHRALELATLRSPIDGVVTRMAATLGAGVDAGQPLVEVTDVSKLDVALTLSVAGADRVKAGQTAALLAGSDASGAPLATGRVVDVSGAVDSVSLGVTARVELPTGTATVRIGGTVFGRVAVGEHANAVVVPLESLVPDGEGFKVFVVDAEGMALSRPVTVGGRSDRGAWIKDGLKIGERVVTRGAYGVSDSAKVSPEKAKSPAAKEKDVP